MLTTDCIVRRNIGARVGRPRASADKLGGVLAMGDETGGPGTGGAIQRSTHHQPAIPRIRTTATSRTFRIAKSSPSDLIRADRVFAVVAPVAVWDSGVRLSVSSGLGRVRHIETNGMHLVEIGYRAIAIAGKTRSACAAGDPIVIQHAGTMTRWRRKPDSGRSPSWPVSCAQLRHYHHDAERVVRQASQPYAGSPQARNLGGLAWGGARGCIRAQGPACAASDAGNDLLACERTGRKRQE